MLIDLPPIRHDPTALPGPYTIAALLPWGEVCIYRGARHADRTITYSIAFVEVKLARDVRPYHGPSQWREVAKRVCACGWNALWHAESWRCLVVRSAHAMKHGPCVVFRNRAVSGERRRGKR